MKRSLAVLNSAPLIGRAASRVGWLRLLSIGVLLSQLSACAVQQSPLQSIDEQASAAETQAKWRAHRDRVSQIDHWRVNGKIAVKAGDKGGHATLRWNKAAEIQKIELYGPLGGGRVEIETTATGAKLKDTRGAALSGESVEKLIEQRLGWPLPFDQLPNWLRGLPASEQAKMQWDEQGRITRMDDQGWQVSYPTYQDIDFRLTDSNSNPAAGLAVDDAGLRFSMPRMIELNALPGTLKVYDKNGDYLGENFFIRVIVKSWQ